MKLARCQWICGAWSRITGRTGGAEGGEDPGDGQGTQSDSGDKKEEGEPRVQGGSDGEEKKSEGDTGDGRETQIDSGDKKEEGEPRVQGGSDGEEKKSEGDTGDRQEIQIAPGGKEPNLPRGFKGRRKRNSEENSGGKQKTQSGSNGQKSDKPPREHLICRKEGHRWLVTYKNGSEETDEVFRNKELLIFKLRRDWEGDGHKVPKMTSGHYIVMAPKDWQREGQPPVEQDFCTNDSFVAHYFYKDTDKRVDGFKGQNIPQRRSTYELEGKTIYDDSDQGPLYAGNAPRLLFSDPQEIKWVRIGEEGGAPSSWAEDIKIEPDKNCLDLASILDKRQGWFYIRIYDDNGLTDSSVFRYLQGLREILVDGAPYSNKRFIAPSASGYPLMKLQFDGEEISIKNFTPSQCIKGDDGYLLVQPHRSADEADEVKCELKSDSGQVRTRIRFPRVWWRIEQGREQEEWRATPFEMTRQEFKALASKGGAIRVELPSNVRTTKVGFDSDLEQQYRPQQQEIKLPFKNFQYHDQIRQSLDKDAHLNLECHDKMLSLVHVLADPAIEEFTATPSTAEVGQPVELRWAIRNGETEDVEVFLSDSKVKSRDSKLVTLRKTTLFTLKLRVPKMDDELRQLTVVVQRVSKCQYAKVRRSGGDWRRGKGFSCEEIKAAGLTKDEVAGHSLPIDLRRRTAHNVNIETLKR